MGVLAIALYALAATRVAPKKLCSRRAVLAIRACWHIDTKCILGWRPHAALAFSIRLSVQLIAVSPKEKSASHALVINRVLLSLGRFSGYYLRCIAEKV